MKATIYKFKAKPRLVNERWFDFEVTASNEEQAFKEARLLVQWSVIPSCEDALSTLELVK